MRVTAKERILLHLLEFAGYADAVEVPASMTQEGIAQAVWILVPHVTQYVRPLIREGLARERIAHIQGGRRRRKVYDLTEAGRFAAIRLRNALKAEMVRSRDANGVRDATVAEVLASAPGISLLEVVRRSVQSGVVDLESLAVRPAEVSVQMLSNAPRVEWFVGREEELGAVTQLDGPRLFVVRGVAGIGKTTLAARACELLRTKRNLFWHRVRAWDTPKSVLAALGDFLVSLGKPGLRSVLMRGDLAQAIQVLREDVRGSRSFLVFDDVHDAGPELLPFFRALKDIVVQVPDVHVLCMTRRTVPFYDRRDVILGSAVKEIELRGLDPAEFAQVLSGQPGSENLADACRAVGGHPLFLQLVRSATSPPRPAEIRRDVHQFVEETVYRELGEPERQIMKVACLYRVPMPRAAFLPEPGLSHNAFLSLVDRALITPIGEKGFGVHETIQGFFESVVTPMERQGLAAFATRSLRDRAAEVLANGDVVASIDYLSNALRVAPPDERVAIEEELGDAYERVGDLPAALVAYKEGLKASGAPDTPSRIHRKIATAFLVRGEMKPAESEIEAASQAIGDLQYHERARIDLLRCRLASFKEEWEEAREHGEAALRVFQEYDDPRGQAEVLLELGGNEFQSPAGDVPAAEKHLQMALALCDSIGDDLLRGMVHKAMAHLYAYRIGDAEKAGLHVAAIDGLPKALQDPHMYRGFVMLKGYYCLELLADTTRAEAYFAEALALGRKIYDPDTMVAARYGLGFVAYFRERFEDAHALFEQSATDFASLGHAGLAVESLSMVAECCLLEGDFEGFRSVTASLREPGMARGVEARFALVHVLDGVDALLRHDEAACHSAFAEALRQTEAPATKEWPLVHAVHTLYGVALAVMGQTEAAAKHSRQADLFLREHGMKARLELKPKVERRLETELRLAVASQSTS